MNTRNYRIGIFGSGPILHGLIHTLNQHEQLEVASVVIASKEDTQTPLPVDNKIITKFVTKLLSSIDLLVECSQDVIQGTDVILAAIKEGIPVVTMNTELQLVSGSQLAKLGTVIEAEGDQPGSLAALDLEVRSMGFTPMVYGNIKNHLNLNPKPEEMRIWASKLQTNLATVTAATDGTTIQLEQALVANHLSATIACQGLSGIACQSLEEGALRLAEIANTLHEPLSDYILLSPEHHTSLTGVFIVATHNPDQMPYLSPLKLGSSPYYLLTRPYHLSHLEIPKTIMAILTADNRYNFNNGSAPKVLVAATPKGKLLADQKIDKAVGSFYLRGEAVLIKNHADCVPISLLDGATFKRIVEPGKLIRFKDVIIPPSQALSLWLKTLSELGYRTPTKAKPKKVTSKTKKVDKNWTNSLFQAFTSYKLANLMFKR